jgi:lysophospholipase L1-like esterase
MKPEQSSRRARPFSFVVAAVVGASLLALAVAEVVLRVAGSEETYVNALNSFHENDAVLGYRGRPGLRRRFRRPGFDVLVVHDEKGFRRVEDPNPPSRVVHRLFVLGDSVVWGWGVDQGTVMTDDLAHLMPDYEVRNRGINGAGTVVEFTLFDNEVKDLVRPGDAVVVVFVFNDFWDNLNPKRLHAEIDGDRIATRLPEKPILSGSDSILDRLRVFNSLHAAVNLWSVTRSERRAVEKAVSLDATHPSVVIARHFLEAFRDSVQARSGRLVVAYLPGRHEVPGEVEEEPVALEQDRAFRTAFEKTVEGSHVETLDLLPSFVAARKEAPGVHLLLREDGHPSAAGHAVMARAIATRLAQEPR